MGGDKLVDIWEQWISMDNFLPAEVPIRVVPII